MPSLQYPNPYLTEHHAAARHATRHETRERAGCEQRARQGPTDAAFHRRGPLADLGRLRHARPQPADHLRQLVGRRGVRPSRGGARRPQPPRRRARPGGGRASGASGTSDRERGRLSAPGTRGGRALVGGGPASVAGRLVRDFRRRERLGPRACRRGQPRRDEDRRRGPERPLMGHPCVPVLREPPGPARRPRALLPRRPREPRVLPVGARRAAHGRRRARRPGARRAGRRPPPGGG
jgi:hypothetical protein